MRHSEYSRALPGAKDFGDPKFIQCADLIIIFEGTLDTLTANGEALILRGRSSDRRCLQMLHSIPHISHRNAEVTIRELLRVGKNLVHRIFW